MAWIPYVYEYWKIGKTDIIFLENSNFYLDNRNICAQNKISLSLEIDNFSSNFYMSKTSQRFETLTGNRRTAPWDFWY